MAHYKSNWSDPSHYCHQHCLVPLSLLTLFSWSKHFTSIADIICPLSRGGIQQHDICYKTLSGIKGDGRVLTSGTISGGSYGVSATRQLATTKLLRHNNISEPGKLNSPQSVRERESSIRLFLIEVGGVGSNQPRQGGCCVTTNFPPILPTTGTHNNL